MNLTARIRLVTTATVVAACACGAPTDAFVGQWEGTVQTNAATCTGGAQAAAPATTTEQWLVVSSTTGLQISTKNFCGTLGATVAGSVATISNQDSHCSGTSSQRYSIAGSFTVTGKQVTGTYTVHATDVTNEGVCDIPVVVNMSKT